jgi:hypothetical protein
MAPHPLARLFAPPTVLSREPLRVRVQNQAGGHIEFQLLDVDLDDGVLIGRGSSGDVRLPLGNVSKIWCRRRLLSHSVPLWLGIALAGALVGGIIDVFAGWSVSYGAGAGAVFGAFGAFWLLTFFNNASVQWFMLYDEAAA